jgi:ribosomal protein S18 acetylase RimI-like enzyme
VEERIKIREAVLRDAAAMARIHLLAWRTGYRGLAPDSFLERIDYRRQLEYWREILSAGGAGHCTLVAETAHGGTVGFICGGPRRGDSSGGEAELFALYTLEEHRRQGIGRALCGELARGLADRGYRSLTVWFLADTPAVRFYEAVGGRRVGGRRLVLDGVALDEACYAWPDLSGLAETSRKKEE